MEILNKKNMREIMILLKNSIIVIVINSCLKFIDAEMILRNYLIIGERKNIKKGIWR